MSTASSSVISNAASSQHDSSEVVPWNDSRRLRKFWSQLTWSELSGAMGDLGTLIPLLVALARQRSIFLAPALFWGGLSNIATGLAWDVPMCVQPMKSIAAVALTQGLTQSEVTAAGMWMGIIMTLLGVFDIMDLVNRLIPIMVVSGLQVGVGIHLAMKGISMVAGLSWVGGGDSILLALLLAPLSLYWLRQDSKHPAGIYLFLIGVIMAIIKLTTTTDSSSDGGDADQSSSIVVWTLSSIAPTEWWTGLTQGAIPQLPLTTLNSVISVCALAHTLFPEKETTLSRRQVAVSVGVMNLLFCPFGAMPNCHGAGGLAGQHLFGARHGTCVIFLGLLKVLVAVVLGSWCLLVFDALPNAVLGLMLAIAGQELATTGVTLLLAKSRSSSKLRQDTVICMITTVTILGLHKTHYGCLAGLMAHWIYGDGFTDFLLWARDGSGSSNNITTATDERRPSLQRQSETRTLMAQDGGGDTIVLFEEHDTSLLAEEDFLVSSSRKETSESFFAKKDQQVNPEGPLITMI